MLRIGLGMGISSGEVEQQETHESPEEIDAIGDEENNNDFWEGKGNMKNWMSIKMSLKNIKDHWYQVD